MTVDTTRLSSERLSSEVAHVLFLDIAGYSRGSMEEQARLTHDLRQVVRATPEYARAAEQRELIGLDTGDGMALVFFRDPLAPVQCATEVARALNDHSGLQVRMGIHCGPVSRVPDLNEKENVTGSGINMAQRVMDCGDPGHILVSASSAEFVRDFEAWSAALYDLGEFEIKHGAHLHLYNLVVGAVGNPTPPSRLEHFPASPEAPSRRLPGNGAAFQTAAAKRFSLKRFSFSAQLKWLLPVLVGLFAAVAILTTYIFQHTSRQVRDTGRPAATVPTVTSPSSLVTSSAVAPASLPTGRVTPGIAETVKPRETAPVIAAVPPASMPLAPVRMTPPVVVAPPAIVMPRTNVVRPVVIVRPASPPVSLVHPVAARTTLTSEQRHKATADLTALWTDADGRFNPDKVKTMTVTAVQQAIDAGADVNVKQDGWTALTIAAEWGYADVARLLLDRGADPNERRAVGWFPLLGAAWQNHAEVARLLLDHGANVNLISEDGWTALLAASRNGCNDVARLLLDRKVNVNAATGDGNTALLLASAGGNANVELVQMLLDKGADVNARDKGGKTALEDAASGGHSAVVGLLLAKGADAGVKDDDDVTPLQRALSGKHDNVVVLLRAAGAKE